MKQIITLIAVLIFGIGTIFSQGGLGSVVLPGNTTCATQYISVTGCNGDTTLTYNGYTYDLIEIGGQCWFKENLQTNKYSDGSDIDYPGILDTMFYYNTTGAYAWYDNDSSTNASAYGALYNWNAVNNTAGLCPTGWHVPTDCEWMYLEGTVGMSIFDQEFTGSRGTQGGKLKETGTTHWLSPNVGATNSSGFTGLPSGRRLNNCSSRGKNGYFWTSTLYNNTSQKAWCRFLYYYGSSISRGSASTAYGYSIRCLKDSTSNPSSLQEEKATIGINTFPNPFSTSTTIELPSEPHTLTIYNIVGNMVREEHVIGTTIIERGDLTKGVYMLEVRSQSQTYSGKLVVE